MSLLSNYKVSIYSEQLVKFMRHLQTQAKWNSERYADYGAYLIDQMSFYLDSQSNPQEDLTQAFIT